MFYPIDKGDGLVAMNYFVEYHNDYIGSYTSTIPDLVLAYIDCSRTVYTPQPAVCSEAHIQGATEPSQRFCLPKNIHPEKVIN